MSARGASGQAGEGWARRTTAPFGRRAVRVVGRRELGAYRVLTVTDSSGAPPRAGQFYMLAAVEGWGAVADERPHLPRAFSVMRAGAAGSLEFVLEDVGPGTRRLAALGTGDLLWLTGPLGLGFAEPPTGRRPLLVGGGVGIAPLVILADQLEQLGRRADVLLGFRDREHAPGAELLAGARVATDDGSVGRRALVTELLAEELETGGEVVVYACGPPRMLEAVRELCRASSIPAQLALEAGMACGFGACYGCVVAARDGYRRVCVEGPVFDAGELEPLEEPGGHDHAPVAGHA